MIKQANEFDCELYRLVRRAEQYAEDSQITNDESRWLTTAHYLRLARPPVRRMMSKADLEATCEAT